MDKSKEEYLAKEEDDEELITRFLFVNRINIVPNNKLPENLKITENNIQDLMRVEHILINHTGTSLLSEYIKTNTFGKKMRIVYTKEQIEKDDSLLTICTKKYPKSWHLLFSTMMTFIQHISPKFDKISSNNLVPDKRNIFRAYELCKMTETKVVIVCNEPITTLDHNNCRMASGLAFGSQNMSNYTLNKIYLELQNEYNDFRIPEHGNLDKWALQGVLLLNLSLTGIVNEKNAHNSIWNPFIKKTIQYVCKFNPYIVFMLWGRDVEIVNNYTIKNYDCLISSHPSAINSQPSFSGCNHFIKANELLIKNKLKPINWNIQ